MKTAEFYLDTYVYPANMEFANFIEEEYIPNTRPEVGVSSVPGGGEFYQACLRYHTTTNMTAEEIHILGLQEVMRITQEIKQVSHVH